MSKILIAVSGGIDSMVLLHYLCSEQPVDELAVAHCNFQLRGKESDGDEAFVISACDRLGLACHTKRFDTVQYAMNKGLGIQESARDLRYAWFRELMDEQGYTHLATAHHRDDSIETFFINLLRGSGPKGLSGIKENESEGLIRPLLNWSRAEVIDYAQAHRVEWREDASNQSGKYLRNRIRQELLPLLRNLRPGFDGVMERNMALQKELSDLLAEQVRIFEEKYVTHERDITRFQIEGQPNLGLLLFHSLQPYGFNREQVEDILSVGQSGKQVMSAPYVLTAHRGGLHLSQFMEKGKDAWTITEDLLLDHLPVSLEINSLESPPASFDPDPSVAYLDADNVVFPLILRYWQEGDRFTPLGMKGSKKLSDFLTDIHLSREEKKQVMVLESRDEIAWVLGHRVSEKYKVNQRTGPVLKLWLKEKKTEL